MQGWEKHEERSVQSQLNWYPRLAITKDQDMTNFSCDSVSNFNLFAFDYMLKSIPQGKEQSMFKLLNVALYFLKRVTSKQSD